jgi:hypothetical protein
MKKVGNIDLVQPVTAVDIMIIMVVRNAVRAMEQEKRSTNQIMRLFYDSENGNLNILKL